MCVDYYNFGNKQILISFIGPKFAQKKALNEVNLFTKFQARSMKLY